MKMPERALLIRTAPEDNVWIVAEPGGLAEGTLLSDGTITDVFVPMGHKIAMTDIGEGRSIIRYGHVIGYATRPVRKGEWIRESMISLPETPDLESIPLEFKHEPPKEPLTGYTFMGYRNADGTVGTKNILALTVTVNCVTGFADYMVRKIKAELLPRYPNVDDVVALNHSYGCGVAIDAPGAAVPVRTIRNISMNPNFGGRILVIGLGCEKLQAEKLLPGPDQKWSGREDYVRDTVIMQDESFHGFHEMAGGVMKLAEIHLRELDRRRREVVPASELIVGMQCGGSDAFSGITSNPVAGFAADLIVRAGGSVMFSEVTEVRDAVHLLVPRTADVSVAKALMGEMKWYDDYLRKGEADRSANPAPGNKKGGLSNVVEKALGSIAKSGTGTIVDVLAPGERIRKKGLTFAATPAGDFVCGTLQLAAGMNVHVFMTGRGTPYGLQMVPVIKVGSNSSLSSRWYDLIDLDAGQVALGKKTIEEMGWELFSLILDVASGAKQPAVDRLGLYNDLVLFNPGPVT
jgi:galactarate dehydratase